MSFSLEHTCLKKGSLSGEVALVTGATSNVGKGFAQALAWAGAKVVVVGRNEARGAAVAAEINADNGAGTAIFAKADVGSEADMAKVKEAAIAAFGKVDILLNNAMNLGLNGPILTSSLADMDQAYYTSARAVMIAVQLFVPDMIKRGHGTVSYSTTQFHYVPVMLGGPVYTSAKAAAASAIMSLANEVAGTGVNVFCFCPAGVGAFNPESLKDSNYDTAAVKMPGFPGLIPIEAAGAAMVYSILRGKEMHGTGFMVTDALCAMDYPFPVPETAVPRQPHYMNDMELTMCLTTMGHGFPKD